MGFGPSLRPYAVGISSSALPVSRKDGSDQENEAKQIILLTILVIHFICIFYGIVL